MIPCADCANPIRCVKTGECRLEADPRERALREFCEQEGIPNDSDNPYVVAFKAGYGEGFGAGVRAAHDE